MKSTCKTCNNEFNYQPSVTRGIYCSNKCRGDYEVINNTLKEGTHFSGAARKYIREVHYAGQGCSLCGLGREWNSKPLTLQIDHINGKTTDNRVENLRLLCPNCHTQTDTWGNPNKAR